MKMFDEKFKLTHVWVLCRLTWWNTPRSHKVPPTDGRTDSRPKQTLGIGTPGQIHSTKQIYHYRTMESIHKPHSPNGCSTTESSTFLTHSIHSPHQACIGNQGSCYLGRGHTAERKRQKGSKQKETCSLNPELSFSTHLCCSSSAGVRRNRTQEGFREPGRLERRQKELLLDPSQAWANKVQTWYWLLLFFHCPGAAS